MPRRAANRFADVEFDGLDFHLAGFHLGQVQQIVHQFQQILGRLAG